MNHINRYLPAALLAAAILAAPAATRAQGQTPPPAPGAGKSDDDHTVHHPADSTTAQNTTTPGAAPAAAGSPGPAMGMGMMGGGDMGPMMQQMMKGMMPMMQGMMAQRGRDRMDGAMGMMAPHRIEGRIAFLRTELQITDAQAAAWNAFADVLRIEVRNMEAMRNRMMGATMPAGQMQGGQMQSGPTPGAQMPVGQMPGRQMPGGQMPGAQTPGGQMQGGQMPGAGMGSMAGPGGGISFPDLADRAVEIMTARLDSARAIATAGRALYAGLTDAQRKTADELLAMPMHRM